MMNQKRIALIVAVLVVGLLATPMSAQVNPFSDLKSDHWAYDAIVRLADVGLIEGYPDGTFGGERNFTRYEMAMVFARMLARLEDQVDRSVAENVADLRDAIEATKASLEAQINDNYDDLAAQIAELQASNADLAADVASVKASGSLVGDVALSDEALAELLAELQLLDEDVEGLAKRILRLEGSTPSRAEAQLIAEKVVADALARLTGVDLAGQSALDEDALQRVLQAQAGDLDASIAALAAEFRPELEALGVRLDAVEARLDEHDEAITSLWDRIGNVKLTGKYDANFERTRIVGPDAEYRIDPRDDDSDKFKDKDQFEHKLNVNFAVEPAENVKVDARITLLKQVFKDKAGGEDPALDAFALNVTTPGVLRELYLGKLDKDKVSAPFNKYTLHEKAYGKDRYGANFKLALGAMDVDGFAHRIRTNGTTLGSYVYGAAATTSLFNAFDVTLRGVRYTGTEDGVFRDTVLSTQVKGELIGVNVDALAAFYLHDTTYVARAGELHANTNLGVLELGGKYGGVGADFTPALMKPAGDWKSYDDNRPDWVDRFVHANDYDWLKQGEKEAAGWVGIPLGGVEAKLTVGQRDDAAGVNNYIQGQAGVAFAGIDADLIFDNRVNQADEVDRTLGAKLGANLLGVDVTAKMISRENEQTWTGAHASQRHVVVDGKTDIDLVLPFTLEGRFGSSQSVGRTHAFAKVSTDALQLGGIKLNAAYSMSRNDLKTKFWWRNDSWTNNHKNVFDFGANYEIENLLGFKVTPGYELRMVWAGSGGGAITQDGTPRHTLKGTLSRQLWEGNLSGEVRYVMGGTMGGIEDEYGNDRDLITKVKYDYPIFAGADLNLAGTYVSSKGDKRDDYEIYNVKAGLSFSF